MHELHELRDKLCNELKAYGRKEMNTGALDIIDKLAHSIKNIDKIIDTFDAKGYSEGMRYPTHSYGNHIADKLREMMRNSTDEVTRMELQKLISSMR